MSCQSFTKGTLITILLLLFAFNTRAQLPLLPGISGAAVKNNCLLKWMCQYDDIKSITVLRSADSAGVFTAIGKVRDITFGEQTFTDGHPLPGSNWYQLKIVFNDNSGTVSEKVPVYMNPELVKKPEPPLAKRSNKKNQTEFLMDVAEPRALSVKWPLAERVVIVPDDEVVALANELFPVEQKKKKKKRKKEAIAAVAPVPEEKPVVETVKVIKAQEPEKKKPIEVAAADTLKAAVPDTPRLSKKELKRIKKEQEKAERAVEIALERTLDSLDRLKAEEERHAAIEKARQLAVKDSTERALAKIAEIKAAELLPPKKTKKQLKQEMQAVKDSIAAAEAIADSIANEKAIALKAAERKDTVQAILSATITEHKKKAVIPVIDSAELLPIEPDKDEPDFGDDDDDNPHKIKVVIDTFNNKDFGNFEVAKPKAPKNATDANGKPIYSNRYVQRLDTSSRAHRIAVKQDSIWKPNTAVPITETVIIKRPPIVLKKDSGEINVNNIVASKYLYSDGHTGHVYMNLPELNIHKYTVRFFDRYNRQIMEIPRVQYAPIIIDKRNFQRRGIYKFIIKRDNADFETGYLNIAR